MKDNFIKSSAIYFIGTLLLRGISFFTLPIYTRLMLPEDYGLYSLFTASLSIVTIFIGLQIQGTVNLSYNSRSEEEFESYVANISIFPFIILLLCLGALVIIPSLINVLQVPSLMYGVMMLVQAFIGVVVSIYTSELIIKKQPKKHLCFSLVFTLLTVLLSVSFVLMMRNQSYFAMVMASTLANIIVFSYILMKYIKRVNVKSLKQDWLHGLKLSLPLIFHVLSHQVLNVADRFMLAYFKTDIDVAIYSVIYSVGAIVQMIWTSINNAWVPWYFDHLREKCHDLIKVYAKQYIIFFSVGTTLFLLASPEITLVLGGKQYESGIYSVPLIVLAYFFVFLYGFYVNYEFAKEKTTIIPIATLLAAIVNIVLNIYIIPKYGIIGASFTTAVSYFLMLMFHYIVVVKGMKHRDFPDYYMWISIFAIFISMLVTYLAIHHFIIRCILCISIIIVYSLYLYYFVMKRNQLKLMKK